MSYYIRIIGRSSLYEVLLCISEALPGKHGVLTNDKYKTSNSHPHNGGARGGLYCRRIGTRSIPSADWVLSSVLRSIARS
jgi:hypothetical protein